MFTVGLFMAVFSPLLLIFARYRKKKSCGTKDDRKDVFKSVPSIVLLIVGVVCAGIYVYYSINYFTGTLSAYSFTDNAYRISSIVISAVMFVALPAVGVFFFWYAIQSLYITNKTEEKHYGYCRKSGNRIPPRR